MAGYLEKNIASAARALERAVARERWCRERGFLQGVDPRLKIVSFAAILLACSLAHRMPVIFSLYVLANVLAFLSRIPVSDFTKRVWIFVPVFTAVIAIPALFLVPGTPIASLGPLAITREGGAAALTLVLRVSASVSYSVLFILTTPWSSVLSALRSLRLPAVVVSMLALCYRYLLLLLRTLSELFMARQSRVIGMLPMQKEIAFASRTGGFLFLKSLHLSEEVYMALVSRGWNADDPAPISRDRNPDVPAPRAESSGSIGARRGGDGGSDPSLAFELEGIHCSYPGNIAGLEIEKLAIPRGRCTMLLGPNGSGKSTLLKVLDGLMYPGEGIVRAFGRELSERSLDGVEFRRFFRSTVGLVFQDADIQCFSPTVREELAFGPRQARLAENEIERRVEAALAALGIAAISDRYPYELSGGEKKRVALASILTMDLEAYLLDEPTANLDPATEGILIDILRGLAEHGKTLVVATQDLMLARHIGDFAVVLGAAKRPLFIGPVEGALEDTALLQAAGLVHAHRHPHRLAPADFRHTHYTEERGV